MRHIIPIIPISGKDSLATAIVQLTRRPSIQYELFFNDVGCELPETYEWLDRVESKLKLPVIRVGKSLEDVISKHGILPSPRIRFCTKESKIQPMEKFIGDQEVTLYFGIRADEDRAGFSTTKQNIAAIYPLKDLGIGIQLVYQIVDNSKLTPPRFIWSRLYDTVVDKLSKKAKDGFALGDDPEIYIKSLPRWIYDNLFSWRSRSNCYFCFFQAMYEWAGLLEHHPELFNKAQKIEEDIGGNDQEWNEHREKPFTWIPDYSLNKVRKNAEVIFSNRVNKVIKFIQTKEITRDPVDLLSVTSCGLFCGK